MMCLLSLFGCLLVVAANEEWRSGLASVVSDGGGFVVFMESATRARMALAPEVVYEHLLFATGTKDRFEQLTTQVPWVRVVSKYTPTIAHVLFHIFHVEKWDAVLCVDRDAFLMRDFGDWNPLFYDAADVVENGDVVMSAHADLVAFDKLYDATVFSMTRRSFDVSAFDALSSSLKNNRRLLDSFLVSALYNSTDVKPFEASFADVSNEHRRLVKRGKSIGSPGTQEYLEYFLGYLRSKTVDRLKPQTDLMIKIAERHAKIFMDDLSDTLGVWRQWTFEDDEAETHVKTRRHRLPHVLVLQLIEKFGVVCDENGVFIDQLLLVPRFCCCHLNLRTSNDLAKSRDLDIAADLLANSLLTSSSTTRSGHHHPFSRSKSSASKASSMLAAFQKSSSTTAAGDRQTATNPCEEIEGVSAAASYGNDTEKKSACDSVAAPSQRLLDVHHCDKRFS